MACKLTLLQIYDKYIKQYHKYTTIKRRNFATVNDKCNLKTYCYGFLSSIGEKENHPRLFRQRSAGRSIGKDLGGGVQGPDKRSPAPVFVVVRGQENISRMISPVAENTENIQQAGLEAAAGVMDRDEHAMFTDALPKQQKMLMQSGCLVLPFFRQKDCPLCEPADQSSLNYFASAWAAVENILLAATAEGLACAFRIPIGNEPEHVKRLVNAPEGYEFTCFLAIGHAAPNAHLSRQKEIRTEERIHQNIW